MGTQYLITLEHVSKSFGSLKAVDDANCTVRPGEILSIVGESGSGKTTLAKMMVGLIKPDQGRIVTQAGIQMVFQDPHSSLDPLYSVRSVLNEALYRRSITAAEREKQLCNSLTSVGLDPTVLDRLPHEFSGGQRQRIAIARALLTGAPVLVLDEPTSALDVLVQKQILDLLKDLKTRYQLTYIFISHNLRVVKNFSDTIAVMREGRIVEQGPAHKVFKDPRHAYTRQLLSAAFDYSFNQP
jgi:ABC-type dipeptide/oligopeptide/nickel transport system ATPase subunit